MLTAISKKVNLDISVKKELEDVIKYISETEGPKNLRSSEAKEHDNVSTIHQAVLADLANMYTACYNPVLPPFSFLLPYLFSHVTSCHMIYHLISHLTFIT